MHALKVIAWAIGVLLAVALSVAGGIAVVLILAALKVFAIIMFALFMVIWPMVRSFIK